MHFLGFQSGNRRKHTTAAAVKYHVPVPVFLVQNLELHRLLVLNHPLDYFDVLDHALELQFRILQVLGALLLKLLQVVDDDGLQVIQHLSEPQLAVFIGQDYVFVFLLISFVFCSERLVPLLQLVDFIFSVLLGVKVIIFNGLS